MDIENRFAETIKRLENLRYEVINLEQILILLTGLNAKNKNDVRHM